MVKLITPAKAEELLEVIKGMPNSLVFFKDGHSVRESIQGLAETVIALTPLAKWVAAQKCLVVIKGQPNCGACFPCRARKLLKE